MLTAKALAVYVLVTMAGYSNRANQGKQTERLKSRYKSGMGMGGMGAGGLY